MKKYLIACSLFLLSALPAFAQSSYVVKDGNGVLQTIRSVDCAGVICPASVPIDSNGNLLGVAGNPFFMAFATGATLPAFSATPTVNIGNINGAPPSLTNPLFVSPAAGASFNVVCTSGCGGGGGGGLSVPFLGPIGLNGTPGGFKDATGNLQPLLGDVTNGQWVNVKASVSIPVTGTFFQATQPISATSLPLPTGAATQTTLASLLTNLGSPFQTGASIGNTSFAATQATASALNATVVGTGTFAVQSSPTSASTWGINTLGSTTAGQSGQLSLGAVTTAAPTYTTAQTNALSLTTAGLLRVDGSGVTQPVSAASLPLPTGAATSANQTNATQKTQIVDGSGNVIAATTNALNVAIVSGGGSGGTASAFAAAFPAQGTAAGMSQAGNMVALTGTAGNLNVQCANCSGSGVSTADKAAFVAGTSLFAGGGGFFQTTATLNPLTTGQQGLFQVTAQRALFSNLRDSSGNELGVAAAPVQVSLANTGVNATAVKVDGSAVTQPISAASLPLPTGASTSAGLTTINTTLGTPMQQTGGSIAPSTLAAWGLSASTQNGATPTNGQLALGQFNTTPTTITSGNVSPFQMDSSGNLLVNVKVGGGTGGTSSTFAAAFPATGTAIGMSQGGNMVALTGTTGNLNVQCANCSGSGVSTADAATFTAGSSLFAGGGGFFQTTATSNPLTTGQQGMFQVTANRALFTNLRNASGVEVGVAATPLQVSLANTAANGTALLVTGTGGTFPVSQATAASLNATVVGTGTFAVQAAPTSAPAWGINTLGSTTVGQSGELALGAVTTAAPTYTTAQTNALSLTTAGALRVDGSGVTQPVSLTSTTITGTVAVTQSGAWSLSANQSVNVAQVNGVTPLMGNGVTGTGSQRVTIASDNTAFSVNATVTQATSANLKAQVDPLTPASWGIGTSTQNSVVATNGQLALGQFNTTPTTITTGNMSPFQLDAAGNLLVNIKAGSSSGAVAQGSTTAGQTGGLTQAAVTTAAPTYTTAQTSPLSLTTAGALRVDGSGVTQPVSLTSTTVTGTVAVTQSGSWSLAANQSVNVAQINGITPLMGNGVTGTGSQRVTIASDNTAFSVNATVTQATSSNLKAQVDPLTPASWGIATATQNSASATNGQLALAQFNTTPTTITTGNMSPMQLDASGNLKVNIVAGASSGAVAQGSTTAGQTGSLTQAAVTTAAPTYTTAQTSPLSLTTAGELRTLDSQVLAAVNSAIPAGTAIIGKVGIDQTTPGTTNLVALAANQSINVAQIAGTTTATGSGVMGAGTQRIALATDSPGIVGLVSNAASAVATTSLNVPTNGYGYAFNGTSWDQLQVDGSKFLKVNCAAGCTGAADTTANLVAMNALNSATVINLVGTVSTSVLLSGTWVATITPEVSADGGTTWVATQFWNVNTHAAVATVTANGTYDIMGTGGKSQARVRISAFTSGTVTGNLKATSQAPSTNDGLIALTGTQPVNLAQVAGVATPVGSGVQATAPRMTLATDSPGIVALGQTIKSASVPVTVASDQSVLIGSDPSTGKGTPSSIPINVSTATTTQLVALSGSTKIYVTSYDVLAGGTGNITFEYGTGSNCGTGTTTLTGAYPLTAQAGVAKGSGMGAVLIVPAGNALCVLTSAAVQMSGSVSYQQF